MNWHDHFTYDPATGIILWKERPRQMFKREWAYKNWNRLYAGKEVGKRPNDPERNGTWYIRMVISMTHDGKTKRVSLMAHRIAWEMYHGPIPEGMVIDHVNGKKSDNRIENLRVATVSQNGMNSRCPLNNKYGMKGVCFAKATNKWQASITVRNKQIYLGQYYTKEEAYKAYCTAAKSHHAEFAKLN